MPCIVLIFFTPPMSQDLYPSTAKYLLWGIPIQSTMAIKIVVLIDNRGYHSVSLIDISVCLTR